MVMVRSPYSSVHIFKESVCQILDSEMKKTVANAVDSFSTTSANYILPVYKQDDGLTALCSVILSLLFLPRGLTD